MKMPFGEGQGRPLDASSKRWALALRVVFGKNAVFMAFVQQKGLCRGRGSVKNRGHLLKRCSRNNI